MAEDADGDGEIQPLNKINVWNIQTGTTGYIESDYNLNGQVNNLDKNDFWFNNNGKMTYIPD